MLYWFDVSYFNILAHPVNNRIIGVPECCYCHVWYCKGLCWGNCRGRLVGGFKKTEVTQTTRLYELLFHEVSLPLQLWMFVRSGETHHHFSPSTWGKQWGGWRVEIRFPTQSTRTFSFTDTPELQIVWGWRINASNLISGAEHMENSPWSHLTHLAAK